MMEPFEIDPPGICPECKSAAIYIRIIPDANQSRVVCMNCGHNYAIPHIPPKGTRNPTQQAHFSDKVLKHWGYQCYICGRKTKLHAHHIIPVEKYPELQFNPRNGIVLCEEHHIMAHGKKYHGGES